MAKILSILTLVFALGAAFLGFQSKGRIEQLQAAAEKDHTDLGNTKADLTKTKDKLKMAEEEKEEAKAETEKTKATLATTEADLTKTKGELEPVKTELTDTKAKLADAEKKIAGMVTNPGVDPAVEMTAMKTQLTDLESKNKELEIVKAELTTRVETLQDQRKELDSRVTAQAASLNRYEKGIMRQGIRGRVLAVNTGWGFCVLSVGDRQGAAANKIMIVSRGGQAIGKVRISSVETSQSVADIIPASFVPGTYVQPGDDVIFRGDEEVRKEPGADAAGTTGNPVVPVLPKL